MLKKYCQCTLYTSHLVNQIVKCPQPRKPNRTQSGFDGRQPISIYGSWVLSVSCAAIVAMMAFFPDSDMVFPFISPF